MKTPTAIDARVRDIAHLTELVGAGWHEYILFLRDGAFSRKFIAIYGRRGGKAWRIENGVDGSVQTLTTAQLYDYSLTNIGRALQLGALYVDMR